MKRSVNSRISIFATIAIVLIIFPFACTRKITEPAKETGRKITEKKFELPMENPAPAGVVDLFPGEHGSDFLLCAESYYNNLESVKRNKLKETLNIVTEPEPEGEKGLREYDNNIDIRWIDFSIFSYLITKNEKHKDAIEARLEKLARESDDMWGGFFNGGEDYRKDLAHNAMAIRMFARFFSMTGKDSVKMVVEKNIQYIMNFLSDRDGGFFGGQFSGFMGDYGIISGKEYYSMSEEDRRKVGMPAINRSLYTRGNSLVIGTLLEAADIMDRQDWRDAALGALSRLEKGAYDPEKGAARFINAEGGQGFGRLSDNAYLLSAYIDAYEGTGDSKWLDQAVNITSFINKNWQDTGSGGYFTGLDMKSTACMEDNVLMARNLDRLYHLTDNEEYHSKANVALEIFMNDKNDDRGELAFAAAVHSHLNYPLKIAVVGSKADPATDALRVAARKLFEPNKVVMTLDPETDAERLEELSYQARPEPTLYACVKTACSMPVSDPEKVQEHLGRFAERYLYGRKGSGKRDYKLK